jgi:hypothetical protein
MRWRVVVPAVLGGAAVAFAGILAFAPQAITPLVPGSLQTTPPTDRLLPALAGVVGAYAGWVGLSHRLSDPTAPLQAAETEAGRSPEDDDSAEPSGDDEAIPSDSDEPADESGSTTAQTSITMGGHTILRFGGSTETASTTAENPDTDTAATDPVDDESSPAIDGEGTADEATASGIQPDRFDAFRRLPPEEPQERSAAITGAEFDQSVAGQETEIGDTWPYEEEQVRQRLAETLLAVDERANRRPPAETRAAIERGTWTDDPVAAAFLSAEASVSLPFRERLRAWLTPRAAFARAVDRTVEAIGRRVDGGERR